MFDALKTACRTEWDAYVQHAFVRQLATGELPEACFRHYLLQDYLFLIHFARAYALAIYKADTIADMQHAKAGLAAILDDELSLHVEYCKGWGIEPDELATLEEATATMAYTRYVLERGMSGTLLDLHVALSPCVIGYAEVAQWILAQPFTVLEGNPYRSWIETYSNPDYLAVADAARDYLNRAGADQTGDGLARHVTTFSQATRLEIGFWQMGLDRSM